MKYKKKHQIKKYFMENWWKNNYYRINIHGINKLRNNGNMIKCLLTLNGSLKFIIEVPTSVVFYKLNFNLVGLGSDRESD